MDFQPEILIFLGPEEIARVPFESLTTNSTAALIPEMAERHRVSYVPTQSDLLANQITHLSSDTVKLDETECRLIALQRAGHITRSEPVHLQACYLRETKP